MESSLVFLAGWLYVNFVEYVWHRWVLHSGRNRVHNAHHHAFFTGDYDARPLLNIWAVVAGVLHIVAASFYSRELAITVGLSLFSYLGVLEAIHALQHRFPESRLARWHIEHHRHPRKRFNIFLPIWDSILGT